MERSLWKRDKTGGAQGREDIISRFKVRNDRALSGAGCAQVASGGQEGVAGPRSSEGRTDDERK